MKQSLILIFLTALILKVNAQNISTMTINQDAPVVQTKEIIIYAAPEKIWKVLVNVNNWDKWNNRIKKPNIQEDLKLGTTFTWKTNGSKIKSRIHTVSSNKILGWIGKTFGATAIHNWYLEPTENGTRVKVEESMQGWIIRLMKIKMNKILADDMLHWLEQLKKESEK